MFLGTVLNAESWSHAVISHKEKLYVFKEISLPVLFLERKHVLNVRTPAGLGLMWFLQGGCVCVCVCTMPNKWQPVSDEHILLVSVQLSSLSVFCLCLIEKRQVDSRTDVT